MSTHRARSRLLLPLLLAAGCARAPAAVPTPARTAADSLYFPARALGPLFHDVQAARVFPDSKTFADAEPIGPPAVLAARYREAKRQPGFALDSFVAAHFRLPAPPPTAAAQGPNDAGEARGDAFAAHLVSLWPSLTRPPDPRAASSSLIPLPHPYVVPGGRFREVYYWDSYFTMLGLVRSGRVDLVRDMLDNFAFLVARFGHIPNGNRTYYLGRSQPPFLAAMVGLLAGATDTAGVLRYLPALEAEHAFWMDGAARLAPGEAYRRVVRLRDGALLNRYWDDLPEPRPESYREDWELAQTLPGSQRPGFYRNVRAAAESGWDFSSRWLRDPRDLRTLETVELVPIDLNSLLYHAELTIAALRAYRGNRGDDVVALRYRTAAEARRQALLRAAWDEADGFFYDVRWRNGERVRDRPSLAAAAPLYFGLATPAQGRVVAERLARDFLRPGGLVTTLIASGQQWDSPNGWAPLQWLGEEGARRYGNAELAATVRQRWLALNRRTWQSTGRMMEKYDVVDPARPAGGGEYPGQDGFGWSNGVALAFGALESLPLPGASAQHR